MGQSSPSSQVFMGVFIYITQTYQQLQLKRPTYYRDENSFPLGEK